MLNIERAVAAGVLAALLAASSPLAAGALLPNGEQTFVDQNGQPYSSGRVYFYLPNTTTPQNTWSNSTLTTLNSNPVVLDAAGRAVIWGVGSYREVLKDQYGNTIWDQITVGAGSSSQTINATITGSTTIASCSGVFPINNVSAAPITITFPTAPQDGDSCEFLDVGANSSLYPITLALGPKVMNTGGSSYLLNSSGMAVGLVWTAGTATWTAE